MTVVVVSGTKGSPGATTTAVLFAGCSRNAVLVDADRDGGALATRFGLSREPGLTTLAADRSDDRAALDRHLQQIGDIPVLVGPDDPVRSDALWERGGGRIWASLQGGDRLIVMDAGRHRPHLSDDAVSRADLHLVVVRNDSEGLVALSNLQLTSAAALVVIGSGPHDPTELGAVTGRPVIAVLPHDRRTARTLNGTTRLRAARSVTRSPLGRAGRSLARFVGEATAAESVS